MPAAQKSRHIGGFFVIWEQGSGLGECEGAKMWREGQKKRKKSGKKFALWEKVE